MPRHTDRPSRLSRVTKPQTITRWVPRALEQLEDRLTPSTTLSNTPAWIDAGPHNISNGQTTNIANSPTNSSVSGPVQAVTPDLTDFSGNTLYAGGVNGGVWKTTNALSPSPTWVSLTDNYPSLSISTLTINPDNNQQILAGIGGTADGTYSIDPNTGARVVLDSRNVAGGVFGNTHGDLIGALYSADGGATWKILSDKIGGQNVVGVAVRGTTVANSYLLVATDKGLYRSTNAGTTFTKISGTGILPDAGVFDLAADPGAPTSVINSATWATGVATITTGTPHALSIGQSVIVTGVSPSGYNGTYTVTGVTTNTFTYNVAINPGVYFAGGTVTANPNADPLARNRFYIAMKSVVGTTTGVGGGDIYRSDDGGVTWGTAPVTSPTMRIGDRTTNVQISVFNSGIITNNIVYVAVENNNPTGNEAGLTGNDYGWVNRFSQVSTISWSPNQGGTWTRMDAPRTQTPSQLADVRNDAAGVVTIFTGVRHHLRTGDQVVIENVYDNGDKAATPPVPPRLIPTVNGVWYVTVITENIFTLNNTTFTGTPYDFLHVNQDLNLPIVFRNGNWSQILGAAAGERPEFFDLTADRTSSNAVYLGTDRTAASAPGRGHFYPFGDQGPTTFTSTIWKGDRLINPTDPSNNAVNSAQWSNLTNSGTTNGSAPSADVRDLVMGANGQLIVATGGGLFIMPSPNAATTAVVGASWLAGVATINTALPHNLLVGQSVNVANIASAVLVPPGTSTGYNGTFVVTATTPTSFTYALAADPGQFINIESSGPGIATVQMLSPHGFAVGNNVQILGVVPGGYNGIFTITSTPGATATSAPDVITNATWAFGGVATITTSLLHGVQVGQTVNISGVSVAGYNGSFVVTAVNAGSKQFSYALATYPGDAGPGGTQTNAADPITSAVWSGGVATITTTAANNNIVIGQTVTITGVSINGYNTTAVVTGILGPNRFTYNLVVDPGAIAGTGGNATTASDPINSATWSGGVATITTLDPAGVGVGDTITINGVAINGYNGSFTVVSVLAANKFTYSLLNDPAKATGGLETPVNTDVSIATATWAFGGVATITTTVNSNRTVGERVVIAGIISVGPGNFNGTFLVTSVSGNSFTYALAVDPGVTTRTLPTSFTYNFGGSLPSATTSSSATVTAATVPNGKTWLTLNGNIAVTDIFSVAYDSQSGRFFAGTIDTQAISQITAGGNAYGSIFLSGNLRDSFFDQGNVFRVVVDNSRLSNAGFPDALTKRYYVGTNFANILAHTVDAADLVTGQRFLRFASPLTTTDAFSGLNGADFQLNNANETVRIAMALNQNDPRRAIFGYNGLYEDADPSGATPTGSIVNDVTPGGMTGKVESLLYGGKRAGVNFNQVVYMTTTTGQLWVRGEFGPVFSNITAALTAASGQTGSIYSVVGDPDDYRHIFVAQGGKILESKDFGVTFVNISDNLIGPPTADGTAGPGKLTTEIRTLAIFDSTPGISAPGDLTLVAGGRGGVYRLQTSAENNGGSWTEYGQALPNTVVNDLQLYNNKVLVAGTAGRGIWTIPDVSTSINQPAVLVVTGTAGADIITISVDPNNSNIILVFDGTVTTEWTRGSFTALEVNGLGGADQIIIDSTIDRVTHVPIAGGNVDFVNFKITVDGGGDAGDTLRIIDEGVTTARQVTITNTTVGNGIGDTIFNGSGQILYTGLGLGTIDISTGSGDDNFILTSLMPGQTILRGNDGSETYNTVMDPASTSVLTILETGTTGTDSINVTGTAGADTFTTYPVQVLLGTSAVNFIGIEQLAVFGGNGDDTFNINGAGGTVSNTFDGQDGFDNYNILLDPATPKTYIVADTGLPIFGGPDSLTITGTVGQDTFDITSAQVLLGLGVVNYSGIEFLNMYGLADNDTYNIAQDPTSSTRISIIDGNGTNFLNVTGTAAADIFRFSTPISSVTQIALGASTIQYVTFEIYSVNVFGGLGNDTFNIDVLSGYGLHVDGGTGNDTYNVTLQAAGIGSSIVSVADSGIGGTDVLNVSGSSVDDTIRVDKTDVVLEFQDVLFTSSIEAVQVSAGAGNDTIVVTTQGANANTAVTINGGTGSDILSVGGTTADENAGLDITSALGNGSFTGLTRSLNFTDIQTIGFDGGLSNDSLTWRDRTDTAYGTANNPESGITYTPTNANSGSLRVGDGSAFPSLQFRNITASFIVNGDPTGSNTRDVLTVLGVSTTGLESVGEATSADGSDTFVITDRYVSLTNAALGVMRRVDFAAAVGSSGSPTLSTILVKGGNEAVNGDRFTATPSRLANIVIDGMNPTAGAAADQLTFISNGSTNTFLTSDTKYGAPQTRILQTVDNSGLGFINIENITVFDPSRGGEPPLINVTGLTRINEGAPYTLTLGTVTDPGREVTSYTIHWGDGSSDTYTTGGDKLHSYADGANTFSLTVDIVDQFGLHSSVANPVTNFVTVVNVAPVIAVAPGAAVVVGLTSSVTLGAVTDPGQDTVTSYVVRWGDGLTDTFSTGGVKTHIYAAAGSYAISVDLVDEDGSYANRGGTTLTVLTPQVNDPNKLNLTVAGVGPDVLVYNTDGSTRFGFRPYAGYTGNITVASGDITGDGIDDIVTGVESQISHVKVFDGATGIEIASFLAYEGFKGGVTVAVGDVLGTGHAQIITGAGPGGGPHVKVFNIAGGAAAEVQSFFAYDGGYLGGVTVGAGRLDGSGHEMIVTGARTGSSHVKAFDVATGAPVEMRSFFAFDAGFAGGVNVAAGNGDIAVGAGGSSNGHVKVFRYTDLGTEQSFFAFPSYEGGARVAFGSRAGTPTLVTGTGSTAPPRFKTFRLADLTVIDNFFIGNVAFDGGIYVG